MTTNRRAGFSLAEALVVLAITSVLLILLASVGAGATRAGFRAAARADAVGERLTGAEALRAVLRGVRPPAGSRLGAPFRGDADGFTAAVTAGRPTPCGSGAPVAALSVRLERSAGGVRLVCGAPGRPAAVLLDLGGAPAGFAYAPAGRPWSDRLAMEPVPARAGGTPDARSAMARLWIRLEAAPAVQVLEAVDPPTPSSASPP